MQLHYLNIKYGYLDRSPVPVIDFITGRTLALRFKEAGSAHTMPCCK